MEPITSRYDWRMAFYDLEKLQDEFSSALSKFCNKKSLNRLAVMKDEDLELNLIDLKNGLIKCSFNGELEIEINKSECWIKHECREFRNVNLGRKHFCSHLIKMFLVLKEMDLIEAFSILKHITRNDYDFFPSIRKNRKQFEDIL